MTSPASTSSPVPRLSRCARLSWLHRLAPVIASHPVFLFAPFAQDPRAQHVRATRSFSSARF